MTPSFSPEQIRRAFTGDPELKHALAEAVIDIVHREVAATLMPMAVGCGRDPRQDVDDLTQSVLVSLFEHGGHILRGWDPARGMGLAGFVALVARRRVLRVMTGFRGNLWSVTPMACELLDRCPELQRDELADVEHALELDATLARLEGWLGARGRRLFRAIYVEQREVREVCIAESMTADAVHAWAARVRHKVRELSGVERKGVSHGR
ncbi:MAG: sigma-70 family RNA polymerase sigma factor [Deltaproteobacteria bacterium]|nr:sigma-70 family RNA polymerase sigma factor [Nannocystaceae bacterium]